MAHLRWEFNGRKGTMTVNGHSRLLQSHKCSNQETFSTMQFNQQAVWHWVLTSAGTMLSGLGWKLSPCSYGMLQVGRIVWPKNLRALLHIARTTVTEQEGTKELIHFLGGGRGCTLLPSDCCPVLLLPSACFFQFLLDILQQNRIQIGLCWRFNMNGGNYRRKGHRISTVCFSSAFLFVN